MALTAEGDAVIIGYYLSPVVSFGSTNVRNVTSHRNFFIAKLEVSEVAVGPILLTLPQSSTNQVGQTVVLSVTANTNEFSSFQWRLNGTNLVDGGRFSGTTTPTLSIANIQPGDAGAYSILVKDLDGSVISEDAVLNMVPGTNGPSVTIGLYAGLMINGKAGETYNIKFTTDMGGSPKWTNLTSITLTNDVHFFLDSESATNHVRRFYEVEKP